MAAHSKIILLLACFLAAFAESNTSIAQSAAVPLLEKRISITFQGEAAEEALARIASLGGFTFSYSPAVLEGIGPAQGTLQDVSIRGSLDYLFGGRVAYREMGKHIILTARNAESKDDGKRHVVVTGYVSNSRNGERIAAATVVERQSLGVANTDAFGYFSMQISKPTWPLKLEAFKADYDGGIATIRSLEESALMVNIPMRTAQVKPLSTRPASPLPAAVRDSVWLPVPMEMPAYSKRKLVMRNVEDTLYRKGQISFLPFLGSNGLLSGNVVNEYSLNIIGGYSFGNQKLELGGVFNANRADVEGVQAAGVFNAVNGRAQAVQLAGVGNLNRGPAGKVKIAGVMNVHADSLHGTAIAGVFNYTHKSISGISLAGVFNHQNGYSNGAQIAGVFNVAPAGISKVQLAGVFNASAKEVGGAQVAGVMNVAAGHVRGAQVSGVLNVAKTVGGAQVGLVNFCDSIQGVPVGLLSYVHSGYHHLELAADETFPINVSLYTGVRGFHNIFAAGIRPGPGQVWHYGYGIGTAPRLGKKLDLNIQLTASWLNEDAPAEFNLLNRFALGLDYRFHKNFSLHVAGVLNGLLAPEADEFPGRVIPEGLPIIHESRHADDLLLQVYPGARVGVRWRW